ncbi:hypothetical protein K503DRAFT_865095 [Rhizopogon vinicolor AM-OR11-026]|uniref:Uncharacterized protein n=1 Tax=Rhizopogon vinicolor AM-OR11-026 TaxID=1314800 RepID=A0A1B7N4S8_9AGAM|nr:hypothetical protein K503DRAFT_865095 [Rhizopogon vinicolor AM-OR11-026]
MSNGHLFSMLPESYGENIAVSAGQVPAFTAFPTPFSSAPGHTDPVPSFSLPYVVQQHTDSRADQALMQSEPTLLTFIDLLTDRFIYRMFLNCLAEILVARRSGVTMDEGQYGSSVNFQATSGDEHADTSMSQQSMLQHIQLEGQVAEQSYGPFLPLQGSGGISHPPLDAAPVPGIFGDADYGCSAVVTQNGTSSEQTLYQQPHPGVVQAGQKEVHCTFNGCTKVIRKDGLTRHVNETHLKVAKGYCTHCARPFKRLYLKRKHEVTCRD